MAKPFKTLREKMSPERQERNKAQAARMLLEMDLQELRQRYTELTQEDVAALLKVTQAYVSKFERGGDALLSSLYAYIKALGGELELRARFPDHEEVRITRFEELPMLREVLTSKSKRQQRDERGAPRST
jgi:transcriptional regulator with XRE-family HTH domain